MATISRIASHTFCVLFVITAARTATAQDSADCEEFRLTSGGDGRSVNFYDAEPSGPSIGDVRVGVRKLTDVDGNDAGDLRWYITPIDPDVADGGSSLALFKLYVMMADGMILAETLYEPTTNIENVDTVSIRGGDLAVIGGTGDHASARGTMTQTVGVDGDPLMLAYDIRLNCD